MKFNPLRVRGLRWVLGSVLTSACGPELALPDGLDRGDSAGNGPDVVDASSGRGAGAGRSGSGTGAIGGRIATGGRSPMGGTAGVPAGGREATGGSAGKGGGGADKGGRAGQSGFGGAGISGTHAGGRSVGTGGILSSGGRGGGASSGSAGQVHRGGAGGTTAGTAGVGEGGASGLPAAFFSEYVEGTSNRKALEIYAPSGAGLAGCSIRIYFNGKLESGASFALSSTLAPGETWVLCTSQLGQELSACQQIANLNFNGDDAVVLECSGQAWDAVGQVGVDPGTAWGDGEVRTQGHTLRRRCELDRGDQNPTDAFEPVLQWLGFPEDSFDGLGIRGCPRP